MANEGIEVFIRWMLRDSTSDSVRAYFTIATLISGDDSLQRLRQELSQASLDEPLLEELMAFANARETVALLTLRIGREISPALFKKLFERTLAASPDIEIVSGLVYVAGLFLERHPRAFELPREVVDTLLASEELDLRLAGLKAVGHTTAAPSTIVATIIDSLKRDDWHEKWAALSLLRRIQEGHELTQDMGEIAWRELHEVLATIETTDRDINIRSAAEQCRATLQREWKR